MSERERAVAFLRETYRRRVERVEPFPWGELVVTPSLARVWDGNFAIVDRWEGSAAELRQEMDRVEAENGFSHRKVLLPDEDVAGRLWPVLERLDWPLCNRFLVMAQRRPPDRPADKAIEVLDVGDDDWARGRQAMIELEEYGSDPETVRQLIELDRRLAAAMDVRHLAARFGEELAAYTGLYVEGDVAQIEDVATLPGYRERGLARTVVLHAVAVARRSGAELVFLVADEGDWPKELYRRLGFDPVGVEHMFGRPAGHDSA